MTSRKSGSQPTSKPGLPFWVLGTMVVIVLAFLIISSIWLFRTVVGLATDIEFPNPDFGDVAEQGGVSAGGSDEESGNSSSRGGGLISNALPQKWSGVNRVTVLVLGIDQRCDDDGPTRTDTMMLLTMDPVGLSAAALSLPRDLWVEIPGFGVDRINQAHFYGEIYEYPGGGPALAVETVESTLGVEINYFVTVNFDAFVQLVDEIDGIEVDVTEDIDDDSYPDNCYGYDPFYISAGHHELDGRTALKYARTRATLGGDVDRATRQQQVVLAVRDKILRIDMVPRLLTQAPELWRIFQDNVETNLTLNEIISLALLAQDIPKDSIRTEVLNYDYVYNELTPDGQAVLVPVRENIRALRDELFVPPAIPTPVIENLPQLSASESARVALYNGTPFFGLAAATQEYLAEYNFNVVQIGNADASDYRSTQIIDYGSHPSTTLYLTQILDIPPLNISNSSQAAGDFDVLVILGSDWEVPDYQG